jgi:hypothetical protein
MSTNARRDRSEELWSWVEGEKRLDARARRISRFAWGATLVAVLLYAVIILSRLAALVSELGQVDAPSTTVLRVMLDTLLPLVSVVGILAFIIALLSTIAVFLRFRTASLAEIQARLSAMEQMLTQEPPRQ